MWFEESLDSLVQTFESRTLRASAGAGLFAGACGIFVGYPFDTMKVKLQSTAGGIVQDKVPFSLNGLRLLYRGVVVPMLTAGIMQSMNFGVYDSTRRYILRSDAKVSELHSSFLGGAISGLIMSGITTPIQLLKIQLQTHVTLSLTQLLYRDIFLTRRWGILYRGFGVTAFSDTLGRGIYMYSYEVAKQVLTENFSDQMPVLSIRMTSAAYAGVISWLLLFPMDTIKTLVQSTYSGPSATAYLLQFIKTGEGIKVLYRGCLYAVIRAAPVAATILPLYEHTQEYLLKTL
jgi:solute carrier family 25 (mitochondrial carnitine/acylcarnitine transporter), member 20/29